MKQYRNSERTKKWIRRAFTELLGEKKSIDKITVNELAERADITKTTFYYHYDDIYAVAEEFENELISELNETLVSLEKENPSDYSEYIKKVTDFIKQNENHYKLAANASDLSIFAEKLKTIFTKRMVVMSGPSAFSQNLEKREIQVCFFISACVDTVMQYLRGNLTKSLDTVAEVITEAIEKLTKE